LSVYRHLVRLFWHVRPSQGLPTDAEKRDIFLDVSGATELTSQCPSDSVQRVLVPQCRTSGGVDVVPVRLYTSHSVIYMLRLVL
jgi:hypothetical protein